ncbi:MAG: hypothetical protein JRF28_03340 [Deltaproteobacteria bacterium]|nr:hypothetical protein [Deltaproteobacteria bacterium]
MNKKCAFRIRRLLLFSLLLPYYVAGFVVDAAETTGTNEKVSAGSPVHITSNRVNSDQKGRWVEFTGNVTATQDDGVITADSLKVYYKPSGGRSATTSAIEKMIAQGNVKIIFDNRSKTAIAQKAVYTANDKVLVLSGGTPKIWSDKNVIQGKKITLFQEENRTVVEGSKQKQVEATFYTEGEGGIIK